MILAVSTSSPLVRLAIGDGSVVWSGERVANRAASEAVIDLLALSGRSPGDFDAFVVDIGPGSFSGVKVGVTMVKTWGYAHGRPVAGLASFDLVDPDRPVAIASKRGEVFFREPGQAPTICRIDDLPPGVSGYYEGSSDEQFPGFEAMGSLLANIEFSDAMALVPLYVAPPSISRPKQAHIMGETFRSE